jgi:integrase
VSIIERFHADYDAYHDITPARSNERQRLLLEFEAFAGVPIEKSDETHLAAFLSKLIGDGLHANTVRKKRAMILPFFGWAFDRRLFSAEDFERMRRVPAPRGSTAASRPNPYDRTEITQMWVDLNTSWPVPKPILVKRFWRGTSRYRRVDSLFMRTQLNAIIHLALHAGLRRDEIYYAGLDDIHYDNAYVVVRHAARKNARGEAKPREVPMTVGLNDSLREWIELRAKLMRVAPKRSRHKTPWLCLAKNGPQNLWFQPMRHPRFEEILTTVGPGYRLHRLRHTCGTEWLRAGLPIEQVQVLLGHSRLQQTLAYAEILTGDLGVGMSKAVANFQRRMGGL